MDDPQRLVELITVAISVALTVVGTPPLVAMIKARQYKNGSIKERRRNGGLSDNDKYWIVSEVDECFRNTMKETLDGFKEIVKTLAKEESATREIVAQGLKDIREELRRSG